MDKLCLQWKDFDTKIRDYFGKLREDRKLFDVTLATEDGQQIKAHKIMLSAASDFFSDIFQKSDHADVLIYLKGISIVYLEHVTDFIYKGEVFIAQEDIHQFLETGKELKVNGLLEEFQRVKEDEEEISQEDSETKSIIDDRFKIKEALYQALEDNADHPEYAPVSIEGVDETNNALDVQIDEMVEKNGGHWKCKVCGKISTQKHHIRYHAERHIGGMSHTCHFCTKIFPTRPNLQGHISNIHTELFSCHLCGKSGMNRKAYRNHKRKYMCKNTVFDEKKSINIS